jgi:hypothetical protein
MFEKASNLLAMKGNVIPKLGADNGSLIVAGASNKHASCINYATKICEHILAVAQLRGTLDEFVCLVQVKEEQTRNDGDGGGARTEECREKIFKEKAGIVGGRPQR